MNIEICNEVKISYPASCGNAPKKGNSDNKCNNSWECSCGKWETGF